MENGEKIFQHYVLCSDDLGHDKNSIYFYDKFIIDDIISKGAKVDTVHYWSDGPWSQLKNQFNFTNLLFHMIIMLQLTGTFLPHLMEKEKMMG